MNFGYLEWFSQLISPRNIKELNLLFFFFSSTSSRLKKCFFFLFQKKERSFEGISACDRREGNNPYIFSNLRKTFPNETKGQIRYNIHRWKKLSVPVARSENKEGCPTCGRGNSARGTSQCGLTKRELSSASSVVRPVKQAGAIPRELSKQRPESANIISSHGWLGKNNKSGSHVRHFDRHA